MNDAPIRKRAGHDADFNSSDGDKWSVRKVVRFVFQGSGQGGVV